MKRILPKYVEKYILFRNSKMIKDNVELLSISEQELWWKTFLQKLTKQHKKAKQWIEQHPVTMYKYEFLNSKYTDVNYISYLKLQLINKEIIDNYIYFNNLKIKVILDINNELQILGIET